MYEIRLAPGCPHKYMLIASPCMVVTNAWKPLPAVTKTVEKLCSQGLCELGEKGAQQPDRGPEIEAQAVEGVFSGRMPEAVPDYAAVPKIVKKKKGK
jgi:hypothetical protein